MWTALFFSWASMQENTLWSSKTLTNLFYLILKQVQRQEEPNCSNSPWLQSTDNTHSPNTFVLNALWQTTATAAHNITVRFSGDQRVLCKAGNPVPDKPLQTCLHSFTQFSDVCSSSSVDYLILLGHNASAFDTPRLLLNGGPTFTSDLNEMKVLFGNSLLISKVLRDDPNSPLQAATNKLGNVYVTLFSNKFDAHDALEDVKALRKIHFTAPLLVPNETLVSHSQCTLPNNAFDQATSWNSDKIPSSCMTESFILPTMAGKNRFWWAWSRRWQMLVFLTTHSKLVTINMAWTDCTGYLLWYNHQLNMSCRIGFPKSDSQQEDSFYDTLTFPKVVTVSNMNLRHWLSSGMFNSTEQRKTLLFIKWERGELVSK